MKSYIILLVLSAGLLFSQAVNAQSSKADRIRNLLPVIESMYKNYAMAHHLPGLAFGVVMDGELVAKGSYGYTDIVEKIPVTTSSMFRIASMTKSFTAMAIMQLRDRGLLNLDDPASRFIPELSTLKPLTLDAPPITIRHLLTHGAGFPEDNPWGDRQLADTDKELMKLIHDGISFSNTPGVAYEYSNLGFALLGKIISKVSGISYQEYISKNIWEPLGMKGSTWEYADVAANKLAHGYRWQNETWLEEDLLHDAPDGSWGAMGSMITSIDEFSNYMSLHMDAWPPSNKKAVSILKRSSLREMHQLSRLSTLDTSFRFSDGKTCPIILGYCYGLNWLMDCYKRKFVGHSGGLPGFGSQWRFLPDYGIGVVSFANRTYSPMSAINLRVLDTLIRLAGLQPRQIAASEILTTRKAELVKLLPNWTGAEKSGIFAENFFPDNDIDSLRKVSRTIFNRAGKILEIQEIVPENNLRGSFIIEAERVNIKVYFTLSPENPALIQAFQIREISKTTVGKN